MEMKATQTQCEKPFWNHRLFPVLPSDCQVLEEKLRTNSGKSTLKKGPEPPNIFKSYFFAMTSNYTLTSPAVIYGEKNNADGTREINHSCSE